MECARLSDSRLLPLLREDGEASREARDELERRHLHAVKALAAVCTVSAGAAEELAVHAWRRAMGPPEGAQVGAVRPHALCAVLRTTADWAGTAQRARLKPQLVSWIESYVAEGRGGSAAEDFPRTSMAARAFGALPERSQTVLWHYAVEHDGVARIDQLLGGGTDEVSVLDRRARRELYNAYLHLYREEMPGEECRRHHRAVLAYVEQKSMETTDELTPHLAECAHCTQAVDDLGLMRVHCGALLAEALLPWGGLEYAAAGLPTASAAAQRTAAHDAADGNPDANADGDGEGTDGGWRSGLRRPSRNRLVLLSAALVALCSLVVAVGYTEFRSSSAGDALPPGGSATYTQATAPGKSQRTVDVTATATSTVTATRTAKGPGGPGGPGGPRPPGATGLPAGGALPVGAAVEWLFQRVDGAVTEDGSDNGIVGNLGGDPPPQPAGGALRFAGAQHVVAGSSVLDTRRSFSVSAWVRLDDKDTSQVAVSQDGAEVSGFALGYDAEADRWSMSLRDADAQEVVPHRALSASPPRTRTWTHLLGVYDDRADQIRLYVDGRGADIAAHRTDWPAEGTFVAGRGLAGGGIAQGLRGWLDGVRAYDRALTVRDAWGLAGDR